MRRRDDGGPAWVDALDGDDPKVAIMMLARVAAIHPRLLERLIQALADERPRVRSGVRSALLQAGQSDPATLARLLRRALDDRYWQINSGIVWGLLRWSESLRDGKRPDPGLVPGGDGPASLGDPTVETYDRQT